jgi:hypothetical protein
VINNVVSPDESFKISAAIPKEINTAWIDVIVDFDNADRTVQSRAYLALGSSDHRFPDQCAIEINSSQLLQYPLLMPTGNVQVMPAGAVMTQLTLSNGLLNPTLFVFNVTRTRVVASTTPSSTTTSTQAVTSSSASIVTTTASDSRTPTPSSQNGNVPVAAIVVPIAGALIAAISFIFWFLIRRRRQTYGTKTSSVLSGASLVPLTPSMTEAQDRRFSVTGNGLDITPFMQQPSSHAAGKLVLSAEDAIQYPLPVSPNHQHKRDQKVAQYLERNDNLPPGASNMSDDDSLAFSESTSTGPTSVTSRPSRNSEAEINALYHAVRRAGLDPRTLLQNLTQIEHAHVVAELPPAGDEMTNNEATVPPGYNSQ